MSATERFDVVVVGAGIAGAAAALFLARRGMSVALVDRRTTEDAGARWVNGVPRRVFDEVGLAAPVAPELLADGHRFTVASASGAHRHAIDEHDVLEVDMRLLGARLRADAQSTGARAWFGHAIERVEVAAGRPMAVHVEGARIEGRVFVDASGLPAVVRRAVFPAWPALDAAHLCLAAQEVRHIDDLDGARAYLRSHRVADGEVYARTGVAGGFSLLNVRVDLGQRHVSILTGLVPESASMPNGASLLTQFVEENAWIGARMFGGASAIPLRRPYARLAAPGLALLGDSGSMIYPAHASGIAIGLRAARMLAETLFEARAALFGEVATWRFAARFSRKYGGLLAGYDIFRRLAQALGPEESEALLGSGLIGEAALRAGLVQELPALTRDDLVRSLVGAAKHPRLSARVGAALVKVPLAMAHALTYPRDPDLDALGRWEKRMAAIVGEAPSPIR